MVRFSLCNENGIVAFTLHQYPDLTSVDISFDSRESLHFAITLPENGRGRDLNAITTYHSQKSS